MQGGTVTSAELLVTGEENCDFERATETNLYHTLSESSSLPKDSDMAKCTYSDGEIANLQTPTQERDAAEKTPDDVYYEKVSIQEEHACTCSSDLAQTDSAEGESDEKSDAQELERVDEESADSADRESTASKDDQSRRFDEDSLRIANNTEL